jgi:hypothetical protein
LGHFTPGAARAFDGRIERIGHASPTASDRPDQSLGASGSARKK